MEVHFPYYVQATIHEISSILLFFSLLASGLIICCPPHCYYLFDVRLVFNIPHRFQVRGASGNRTKRKITQRHNGNTKTRANSAVEIVGKQKANFTFRI